MVTNSDLTLIKIISDHYYIRRNKIMNKYQVGTKQFYDKFERIDEPLTQALIKEHLEGKIEIAHDLITKDNKVENIVFDYNGFNAERFWHKAQLMLREEGFINFTAYTSKKKNHLHLYVHKGHTTFTEGCSLAAKLSMTLSRKTPIEWKMFPSMDIPREFNILTLPYDVYQKERGTSWAKHM